MLHTASVFLLSHFRLVSELFYHAQNTAVLCECGFLSNPDEEALLATEEYQYKVAYCIYSGLLKWYDGDVETTDKN